MPHPLILHLTTESSRVNYTWGSTSSLSRQLGSLGLSGFETLGWPSACFRPPPLVLHWPVQPSSFLSFDVTRAGPTHPTQAVAHECVRGAALYGCSVVGTGKHGGRGFGAGCCGAGTSGREWPETRDRGGTGGIRRGGWRQQETGSAGHCVPGPHPAPL